jgi:virulence factor Mce-like protein
VTRRMLTPVTLIAALAVIAILIASVLGGSGHNVRAIFGSAEQLAPGLQVRIAGRNVGHISAVRIVAGRPVVTLEIDEGDIWPLPAGTTAEIRWGSTTSLEYRYIELHPGPEGNGPLPNHALLTQATNVTPVELDQFYRIFRGRTTPDTRALVQELGDTLGGNGRALDRGLRAAPAGLNRASAVLGELGADQSSLGELVRQGERITGALAARQGDLTALVGHAAGTFDTLAQRSADQQAALDQAPQALGEGTGTLRRLDGSLTGLQALVDDLAPGAIELQRLSPVARDVLVELSAVAPLAASTLGRGIRTAPGLTRLLRTGTSFLPELGSVSAQLAPMVGCVLPYAPELAGTLSTWTAFNENYDQGGHYARTFDLTVNPLLVAGSAPASPQIVSLSGGNLRYAMPRPPGLNAGQAWFQPQCDAGPNALNAAADPERGRQ